jgi:signal transduction histidine kinase
MMTGRQWPVRRRPATQAVDQPRPPGATDDHSWERNAWIWDLVFALGLLATVVANLPGLESDRHRALVIGVTVVLAVWYAFTGARALHRGRSHLGVVYLWGAAVVFVGLLFASANLGFILFVFMPQVFIFIERLLFASLAVVGLYAGLAVAILVRADDADIAEILLTLGVSAGFSVVIGAWISGIIRQSRHRAELIAELETTRAALAAERHEAGALAERQRLAADIHDTLAQGFTSILMLTQGAEAALGQDGANGTVGEQLRMIERTARENLAEARSLVAALTPADLEGASLAEALRRLADRHRAETGVPVEVTVHGDADGLEKDAGMDADVVLLRAAQEALANVRKHAGASSVTLALRYADGASVGEKERQTVLTVTDNGCGFTPADADGYGLRGMRARVERSGGELSVDSEPGWGTRIEVTLP